MLSLVLKDFYSWKKNFLLLIFICFFFAIFSILGQSYLTAGFPISFVPIQSVSMTGIDISKQGSLPYLLTTPISRRKYVASRFLLFLLIILVPIFALSLTLLSAYWQGAFLGPILIAYLLNFSIGVCGFAISLPLVLKYGKEKLTLILLILCLPLVLGGTALITFLQKKPHATAKVYQFGDSLKNIPLILWAAIIVFVFALIIGISFYCAVSIMKKKEF